MFKIFKPKATLKAEDEFKTKIELASEIITELVNFGFKIELVLADSLYGESSLFSKTLEKHQLPTYWEITTDPETMPDNSISFVWNHQNGWKNVLNNLRLVIQPTLLLWLISPWLDVFPNSSLLLGFHDLINLMN